MKDLMKKQSVKENLQTAFYNLTTSAKLRNEKLKIEFEVSVKDYATERYDKEHVMRNLEYHLQKKIEEEIYKQVVLTLDYEVLNGLAKQLVEEIDFKEVLKEQMQDRIKSFMTNATGVPSYRPEQIGFINESARNY